MGNSQMNSPPSERTHKAMTHVHTKDTNIEVKFRKALWNHGYRYRKNYTVLPGSPDIVFTKYKLAIFCDAEFWHGKDWDVLKPKLERGNNPEYWVEKISRNRERDERVDKQLLFMGWTVLRFWGKEILSNTDECVRVVEETLFDIKIEGTDFVSEYDDDLSTD